MRTPTYFRAWILQWPWAIRAALLIILISGVVQFVVFAMTQNYVVSYFGAQQEDISFALQITYCGIIASLPIQFRFVRYFETRNMLVTAFLAGIIVSLASLYVTDIYIFLTLRLITGVIIGGTAVPVLILIFSRLPPDRMQVVGLSVFFGTILCASVIIGVLGAWVVENMDWKNVYYYLSIIQVFALLTVFLILNPENNIKKYPLYQLDWTGAVLFLTGLVAFAYTMIYGPQHDWFADRFLLFTAILSFTGFSLSFYRQSLLKRPYIHLHTFRSLNFYVGILLLIFFYVIKDSINLIYTYSLTVLQWPVEQLLTLACFNVLGIILSVWLIAELSLKKLVSPKITFIAGFSLMLFYHIWMYFNYSVDISFQELIIPVFFQGAACGTLFVPIIRFILVTAPMYTGFSATVMAAVARFMASVISISAFFSLQRYFNLENKQNLLRNLSELDDNFSGQITQNVQLFQGKGFTTGQAQALSTAAINRSLLLQSQLRTNMNVFMIMIGILVMLIIAIVLIPFFYKLVYVQKSN